MFNRIDFDIAVRDIGPIDSIIQTAGRCNRNGLRPAAASHFHIYRITNDQGHLFARRIYGTVAMDIAETLLDNGIFSKKFLRIGLGSEFSSIVGSQKYLRKYYNLDAKSIVSKILKLIQK